jgi:hypothetical protein
MRVPIALALLLLAACAGTDPELPSLAGVVTDSVAQVGVGGARIWAIPEVGFADPNGAYRLELDRDGPTTVIISSVLHEPDTFHVTVRGATTLNAALRRVMPYATGWDGHVIPVLDLQGASTLVWTQAYYAYGSTTQSYVHLIVPDDLTPGPDSLTTLVTVEIPATRTSVLLDVRDRDGHETTFHCDRASGQCHELPL